MSEQDEWRDTSEFLPNWNCQKTHKEEGKKRESLEVTEKSWIQGYYIGSRTFTPEGGDELTVHKMRATQCGDTAHLSEGELDPDTGTDIEFFGSGVVNRKLSEDIQPGQMVRLTYLGMVPESDKVKRAYHNWKLQESLTISPITVDKGIVVGDMDSSNLEIEGDAEEEVVEETAEASKAEEAPAEEPAKKEAVAETAEAKGGEEDDDDGLPF